MRILIFIAISISLLITACGDNGNKINLSKEKVTLIIEDLYIVEAALAKAHVSLRDSLGLIYKDQMLKIHGVDENTLDQIVKESAKDLNNYYKINQAISKTLKESSEK